MVRIRSEHAIGYLKGRFQSLKGLRIRIKDRKTHKFATYWVAACVGIHNFALAHEAEERAAGGEVSDDEVVDPLDFIGQGLSSDSSDVEGRASRSQGNGAISSARLRRAREKREQLKRRLLRHKARHISSSN
jgi:hypothetical protein